MDDRSDSPVGSDTGGNTLKNPGNNSSPREVAKRKRNLVFLLPQCFHRDEDRF